VPGQLRPINYAERDLGSDKPWSGRRLRECYVQAAESTAGIGPAIVDAGMQARLRLAQIAIGDAQSPLHGAAVADISAGEDGLVCGVSIGFAKNLTSLTSMIVW
jgi:hypothetical protein